MIRANDCKFKCKKRIAFTLAEVLITLGIIGVVAAMTMPTLMANYTKKALETQYKRGVTVLSNGMQIMMAKNQVPGNIASLPLFACSENDNACVINEYKKYFQVNLSSETGLPDKLKNVEYNAMPLGRLELLGNAFFPPAYAMRVQHNPTESSISGKIWEQCKYVFGTTDGIVFGGDNSPISNGKYITLYMDVNGAKNPNKVTEDLFLLGVDEHGKVVDITCQIAGGCEENSIAAILHHPILYNRQVRGCLVK